MGHKCSIGGRDVELAWTNSTSKQLRLRASKIGEDPQTLWQNLSVPARAEYSLACLLWLLAPRSLGGAEVSDPEALWLLVGDDEIDSVLRAVTETLADANPSDEKKSTSEKSHSQGSNSD